MIEIHFGCDVRYSETINHWHLSAQCCHDCPYYAINDFITVL